MFSGRLLYFKKYNKIKAGLVFVLSFLVNFIIYSFLTDKSIHGFIIAGLIYVISLFVLFKPDIIVKFIDFFGVEKQIDLEKVQKKIETFLLQDLIKTPRIYVLNLNCYLLISISNKGENILFIDKSLIEDMSDDSLNYLLCTESYKIITKLSYLYTVTTLFLGYPLILIDLILMLLNKYKFFIISGFLKNTIGLLMAMVIRIFYFLFVSKKDLIMTDVYASKILHSTRGFIDSIKKIDASRSRTNTYFPLSISLFLPFSNFAKSYPNRILSFKESANDKIMRINSIIG